MVGKNIFEINNGFYLYLVTSNPNPHYSPETLTKITLVNFSITDEGLRD